MITCVNKLFAYQEKFDRAVALYLKLGHEDVFDLIRKHSLYDAVADKGRYSVQS